MWKNIVQLDRPQMTTWRMRISHWAPKALGIHNTVLLFLSNNGCTNAPQFYVSHALPVLFKCVAAVGICKIANCITYVRVNITENL